MELIKVYRYENKEGIGPYHVDGVFCDVISEAHSNFDKYPTWLRDFDVDEKSDYYAACDSIDSLRRWFWGFNKELKHEGFEVKTYMIPKEDVEYGKSMKQLRFKR